MASKKDTIMQNVKNALNPGNAQQAAPISLYKNGQVMTLNVDQVKCFDHNPRNAKGEEYDALCRSIEVNGLLGTLTVSQRPGDNPLEFIIVGGGNTRLSIAKILYEKTKDKKYYEFQAIYLDWNSDSYAIIHHLIENDIRSDYIFIDRALGIRDLKIELIRERKLRNLTDDQLIDILKEHGYPKLGKALLTRMNYAVDTLYPICPTLLSSGLGNFQIREILKLDQQACDLFLQMHNDRTQVDWKSRFHQALKNQEDLCLEEPDYEYTYQHLYDDVLGSMLDDADEKTVNRINTLLNQWLTSNTKLTFVPEMLDEDYDINQLKRNVSPIKDTPANTPTPIRPPQEETGSNSVTPPLQAAAKSPQSKPKLQSVPSTPPTEPGSNNNEPGREDDNEGGSAEGLFVTSTGSGLNPDLQRKLDGSDYDSGLVAATNTQDLGDDIILRDASAHSEPDKSQWAMFNRDYGSSIFTDIDISIHDKREYAPLPDDYKGLRRIVLDKAFFFGAYAGLATDMVVPIDSGAGFALKDLVTQAPEVHKSRLENLRSGHYPKHYIAWWLLLGFSDLMQLNYESRFDLIEQYQPDGELKTILMTPMEGYYSPIDMQMNYHQKHIATNDIAPLFLANAEPKEMQLFFELSLAYNRLSHTLNHDLWSTTGKGGYDD